jgi:N-acetylglucosamine repressor
VLFKMNFENERFHEKKKAKNLQLIKENNFTLVFSMIYKYRSISRAQLAKITRLSPTTISSQVDVMLQKNLIVETGAGEMGTSGRKPIMININEDGYYVVSIEITEEGFHCFLYNLLCECISSEQYLVEDFTCLSDHIINAVSEIINKCNITEEKLIGIAIAVPALIDYDKNRIITSTVVPIDENNDFLLKTQERFSSIPVLLENESGLRAYAEKTFANGNNLVFIDVGVGIGAGIILDGNLFRGSFGLAGEIGHMTIDINGPKCKCGNRGCLEAMSGIPSMIQKILFAIMSGRDTIISEMIHNDLNKINIGVIKGAADKNDELALEVIKDNARTLAYGINNVINLINPQTIVIGGEIEELGPVFLEQVKEYLAEIGLKPNTSKVNIRYSNLKGNTSTLGGTRYLLNTVFNVPKFLH